MEFYNLQFNPFYEKHDHELVGESRKLQLEQVLKEVERAIDSRSPFFVIIRGTVGIGKSFTMEVVEKKTGVLNKINTKSIVSVKFDASLGTSPTKYIQYLCHSTFRSLGKDNFRVLRDQLDTILAKNKKSPEEYLHDITPDLRNAFIKFKDFEDVIWAWLTGEKVDLRFLKLIPISARIETATYALKMIGELTRLLELLNYDGLLMCIDEAEEIALGGMPKAVQVLTMLKKPFEESKLHMSSDPDKYVPLIFCIGFTPETWEIISGQSFMDKEKEKTGAAGLSTFLRRVGQEFILEPFTNEDAENFVSVMLDKARKKPNNSMEPFTKDAIEHINSVAKGVPGYIVKFCKICLEIGDKNHDKKITKEKAAQYLVESGAIPEIETGDVIVDNL